MAIVFSLESGPGYLGFVSPDLTGTLPGTDSADTVVIRTWDDATPDIWSEQEFVVTTAVVRALVASGQIGPVTGNIEMSATDVADATVSGSIGGVSAFAEIAAAFLQRDAVVSGSIGGVSASGAMTTELAVRDLDVSASIGGVTAAAGVTATVLVRTITVSGSIGPVSGSASVLIPGAATAAASGQVGGVSGAGAMLSTISSTTVTASGQIGSVTGLGRLTFSGAALAELELESPMADAIDLEAPL